MMDYTAKLTRPCVRVLEAYQVVPPNYKIILNANENPYDFPDALKKAFCERMMATTFNRYPDPTAAAVREELSAYTGVAADQIIVGCGSDEIMAMLGQTFIDPGDVVVGHAPSFSMYEIWSVIAGGQFVWVPDNAAYHHNVEGIINTAKENNAKLIYLCSPNNPTGGLFPRHDVIQILEETDALVVLDEAYIEFKSPDDSLARLVDSYGNLLVMRTLSKAFGLAGVRCGYCLGPKPLIDMIGKVKSPYNLNKLTQEAALIGLQNRDRILARVKTLNAERHRVYRALLAFDLGRVFPTAANFIYFETPRGAAIEKAMRARSILVKTFGATGGGLTPFRLTIGAPEENDAVLDAIAEALQ
jgi:histidinol-phosphate aminotransferase